MFYSHTFLARKSPLGTVWIAAHLEHKLRRHHVTVTDIPSSVDCIMFPEVPIALRLSAHLLLGVVRIYSKKVDYLLYDSKIMQTRMQNAFGSIDVNLPEDATHAPFHSVTLPDTFELDAWDLDDTLYHEGFQDNHLKSIEEITITDQIPGEGDPYVAFFINEDISMDISLPSEIPEITASPMQEDHLPSVPVDNGVGIFDPGPSNQAENSNQRPYEGNIPHGIPEIEVMCDDAHDMDNQRLYEDPIPEEVPEIEIMRDAAHNTESHNFPDWQDLDDNIIEQDRSFNPIINEKETLSPIMEDMPSSGGQSVQFQLRSEPPTSVASEEAPDVYNLQTSLGHVSPQLAIRPSPPVVKQNVRPRKRKHIFDQSVVLSNKFIKKGLEDPSDLLCPRKKLPCSALDFWKFNNRSRMEQVLLEPLTSGLSTNLQNIFQKDFVTSKLDLLQVEGAHPESRDVQSPAPVPDFAVEMEHLRYDEIHAVGSSFSEFMASPSRREEFTPVSTNDLRSEPQMGTFIGSEVLPTPDQYASTEPIGFEKETPMTYLEEQLGTGGTGFSDIPELLNSPKAEDLDFLEAYDTPTGHQENEEVGMLSVRTRAVAQYLKRQSPATPTAKNYSGNLSLNKVLEGKTRKLCARMFFESLVLKSNGLIDVEQEEAYGDITLKLTSMLSKAQF
ncbi:PREDICTED: sister chromatid cohesion 1 protein 3 isoform X2 [Nelumbo nucifera]|uniref:Sister chromatid cohesion 1 protein 3 isoform X2 n=2 Tax=Nelumbo nucifera TaxID=4432 RepID=A0A1U8QCZ1_NELNU|nr:PREDICTED: sister chromatid cohesion 1 protein 3 isoform X2 [Nelumbo nucifera]DAD27235.1 TPA_asm: hypothetical protein HUJ06_028703 [Nelumbo nucifera]